jgi:hypothetical protein
MDLHILTRDVMGLPAFNSPLRLGIYIHLAGYTSPDTLHVSIKPSVLAERLTATKAQVELSINQLAEMGAINLEKSAVKRGVWEIDMSPFSYLLTGDSYEPTPEEIPIKKLMEAWDSAHKMATGRKNLRSDGNFWRERKDWIVLFEELGEDLYTSIDRYFDDQKYARYGYSFKIFFKVASELTEKKVKTGWRYA